MTLSGQQRWTEITDSQINCVKTCEYYWNWQRANFKTSTDTKMPRLGSHTYTGTVRRDQVKILAWTAYAQFIFPRVIYIHSFIYSLAVGNVPLHNRPLLYIEFHNQIEICIYICVCNPQKIITLSEKFNEMFATTFHCLNDNHLSLSRLWRQLEETFHWARWGCSH